ncbi:MAG: hypothetical protein QGG63_00675 [Candidatus Pacebacteria bacterium]|jgi:hypothetical protein|nr:hypothetical protein [Candidatus Paceibacterota bacterium]|tara:strand:- start:217 stop:672 length:456 start_codon:yes stop_codon:yes gene_type:complete
MRLKVKGGTEPTVEEAKNWIEKQLQGKIDINKIKADVLDILLRSLIRDASNIGYGWSSIIGMDVKDGVIVYAYTYSLTGFFDIYSDDLYIKSIQIDDSSVNRRETSLKRDKVREILGNDYDNVKIKHIDKKSLQVEVSINEKDVETINVVL